MCLEVVPENIVCRAACKPAVEYLTSICQATGKLIIIKKQVSAALSPLVRAGDKMNNQMNSQSEGHCHRIKCPLCFAVGA